MMTSTQMTSAAARLDSKELAIARTLASMLEDALSRSDLPTASGVAHQLAEQVDRLVRTLRRE